MTADIGPATAYALALLRQHDPARADRIEGAYRAVNTLATKIVHDLMTTERKRREGAK